MKTSRTQSFFKTFLLLALVIAAATIAYNLGLWRQRAMSGANETASEQEPLYWVAPMDPNYRRDKPGKSPMGMDLVPVYADEESGGQNESAL